MTCSLVKEGRNDGVLLKKFAFKLLLIWILIMWTRCCVCLDNWWYFINRNYLGFFGIQKKVVDRWAFEKKRNVYENHWDLGWCCFVGALSRSLHLKKLRHETHKKFKFNFFLIYELNDNFSTTKQHLRRMMVMKKKLLLKRNSKP